MDVCMYVCSLYYVGTSIYAARTRYTPSRRPSSPFDVRSIPKGDMTGEDGMEWNAMQTIAPNLQSSCIQAQKNDTQPKEGSQGQRRFGRESQRPG